MTYKQFQEKALEISLEINRLQAILNASRPRFRVKNKSETQLFEAIINDRGDMQIVKADLTLNREMMKELQRWLEGATSE